MPITFSSGSERSRSGLGIMLFIGLLAVGTQTWRIARENPVEALKNE